MFTEYPNIGRLQKSISDTVLKVFPIPVGDILLQKPVNHPLWIVVRLENCVKKFPPKAKEVISQVAEQWVD
jgi:hypothetical protein